MFSLALDFATQCVKFPGTIINQPLFTRCHSMCGIVGHIGPKNSINVVLEGLKRLEYRGYDSAGVSFKQDGEIQVFKKAGKVEELKGVMAQVQFDAGSCIGHTRWATHGEVNDVNSHPHVSDKIAIVHNGI